MDLFSRKPRTVLYQKSKRRLFACLLPERWDLSKVLGRATKVFAWCFLCPIPRDRLRKNKVKNLFYSLAAKCTFEFIESEIRDLQHPSTVDEAVAGSQITVRDNFTVMQIDQTLEITSN